MLSLETLSLRDAGGGPSSSFFASATAGSYNVAAGEPSSSSLFSSAAAEPSSSLFSSAAAANPQDAYVEWIAEIIAAHGGIMTSANLGSSLVADDAEKYATVRATWGGLCSLLSRNPQRFRLLNNQPLNHVAVVGATRRVRKAPKPEPTQPTPDAAAATAHADEVLVVAHTQEILAGASERALKAVDLANALRSRVGVAVLARVRTHRGGLLSLLERHDDVLEVFRVPKHDVVRLRAPPINQGNLRAAAPSFTPSSSYEAPTSPWATTTSSSASSDWSSSSSEGWAPWNRSRSGSGDTTPLLGWAARAPPRDGARLRLLMSDDYVPTSPWPRDDVLDAALVDAIRAALAQQPSKPSTLTKIRAHLKAARRLPRSVKTVPLRALLDAYAEFFYVDGVHVHARPAW